MSFEQNSPHEFDTELEPELKAALTDFRLSVDAWAGQAISRPCTATVRARIWRNALGWALGCVLVAGGVGGGFWEHGRHVAAEQARIQQQRQMELERQAAENKARLEQDELLASVDSAVARQAPSAMDTLADLMAEDESR